MTIGIIAAAGSEPGRVIAACRTQNREFFVVALEGYADPAVVEGTKHAWVRLGAGGQMLKALRKAGASEVVFSGTIKDFSLKSLSPDMWTIKFIARHGAALFQDQDKLITALVTELEKREGFRVVDAEALLSA